jgi:MoxR-like ATPase
MPNVTGMDPAPTLRGPARGPAPYGAHAFTTVDADGTVHLVAAASGATLATVTADDRCKVALAAIANPLLATATNAFVRPYGKVKVYWRAPKGTNPYRWHPVNGAPTKPATVARERTVRPAAPVVTPAAPVAVQPEAQPAPVAVPATVQRIESEVLPHPVKVKQVTKSITALGDVMVPNDDHATLETAWSIRSTGAPAAVIVTGPAGTAKTRLIAEFAASKGVGLIKVDAGTIQMATDWYGTMVQDAAGQWTWEWSDLALAVMRGTPCIILIDEINRTESARAQAGIFGLLDWTRQVKPTGAPHSLRLPAGIMFAATLNEGPEYVGTVEVDAALRDRFAWGVRMSYTAEVIETRVLMKAAPTLDKDVAKRLVRVATTQRAKRMDDTLYPSGNVISTRVLIDIALAITVANREPSAAIWAAVRGRFWVEDEPALRVAIEAQFGPTPEPITDLPDDDDLEQMLASMDAATV